MAQDIGSIVERIMKDPEFVGLVNELRGTENGEVPDPADISSRLPEMLRGLAPMLGSGEKKEEDGKKGEEEKEPVPAPRFGSFNRANAERLLAALKPYLGERRREMIARCVSVLQITDLIGAAGLGGAGAP